METGYKVLRNYRYEKRTFVLIKDGLLRSCNSDFQRYFKNKDTHRKPNCGPMAVFETLQQARNFCRKMSGYSYVIYEVEFQRSEEYHLYTNKEEKTDVRYNYPGTAYADVVRIVKEVEV